MFRSRPTETADSFANHILMRRTQADEDILIVEGPLDERLYECYVCGTCKISRGGVKEKIIAAMEKLKSRGFNDVVAIVDADFDHINSKSYGNSIYLTDTHDVETMMCAEIMLEALKVKCKGLKKVHILASAICDISKWIGVCRYKYKYAYKDKDGNSLDFNKFIQFVDNLPILNDKKFFNELERFNKPISKKERELVVAFVNSQAPRVSGPRAWQFSQGHDILKIISVVLEYLYSPITEHEIGELLLELYKSEDLFNKTNVYQAVSSSHCSIWAN